ncbi:MAG TPA: SGNH/GDSL hydrolase family protein [Streptosporangiaceae bacterium]|nr:SGNH/GDSL hydrolase family protein [Streptosporangiaceae bacterium]
MALALVIWACVVPAAAAVPQATQPAVHYVALGDSYASGVGAGPYLSASGSCDRSAQAYPALWAAAHDPVSYVSQACSGATTATVLSGQLSALSPSTTLVSLTIGGNDVGFVPVMVTCVVLPTSFCVRAVHASEAEISADLPGELDKVLSAIAAHAPDARVVVLGYPHLYDLSKSASCAGLSTTDRTDLNQAADQLDAQIQAAARRHGDVFADVRPAFSGHEICDSPRWLNAVDWTDLGVSYHPTAAGQAAGYYQAFSASAG